MKKILKSVLALVIAISCVLGVTACDEVKGGSKIQRVTITLNVNGTTQDFNFELYTNYAPGTIKHFTELATKGYYNDSAISNLKGHVEFGAYSIADGEFKSKENDYLSIITADFAKNAYVGPNEDARYDSEFNVVGEFLTFNGYAGNSLDLNGSLVLKREVDDENPASKADSGRATMAITFGTDSYFTSASEFAIIGKICNDDADDADETSYARLKAIMEDYAEDEDGNVYYYYSYESGKRTDDFGKYFMLSAEDGSYYAKDASGDYVELVDDENVEDDAHEVLLEEFETYSDYFNVIPYGDVVITVEKITFAK